MHYKDGTEARLYDTVKGKPYNTPHEVIGTVVALKAGHDSCGLAVLFTKAHAPWGGEHGVTVVTMQDYGTVSEFELVHPSPLRALDPQS
jgi:hypothetical protein